MSFARLTTAASVLCRPLARPAARVLPLSLSPASPASARLVSTPRPAAFRVASTSFSVRPVRLVRRAYSTDSETPHPLYSFADVQKLTQAKDSKVVLVDAREPGELADTGRIPGAINIPVKSSPDAWFLSDADFEDRFDFARPAQDTELVFYCKAGVRSRAAAQLAKEAGWTRVGEYPGSWMDWAGQGGPVERS